MKELKEVIIFRSSFNRIISHHHFPNKLLKRYFELKGVDPLYYREADGYTHIKYTGDFERSDVVIFSNKPPSKITGRITESSNLVKRIKRDDPIFIDLVKNFVFDGYRSKTTAMKVFGGKIVKVPYDTDIKIIIVAKREAVVDNNRFWRQS